MRGQWRAGPLLAEASTVVGTLVAAVAVRVDTLGQPLLESHAFRQAQTAFTAKLFHTEGISWLHPEMPVLGEPWEVPFEFPLFQALASIPMSFGVSPDRAMRVTALLCFLATAALLWGLVRYVTREAAAALATLLIFCFSPFGLLWARGSLIEYLATAGGVGFAWAAIAWLDHRRWWFAVAAGVGAAVALLVKPTTGVVWFFPVLGYACSRFERARDRSLLQSVIAWVRSVARPPLVLAAGVPLIAALAWTRHANQIKASSITTAWLTESSLRTWNFGTLDQRLDYVNWITIGRRIELFLLGNRMWLVVVIVAVILASRRGFWLGMGGVVVAPITIFFNLYVVHDYYLAAISPAVAALVGLAVAELAGRISRQRATAALAVALTLTFWLIPTLWSSTDYWGLASTEIDADARLSLSVELRERTEPSERVVLAGLDWAPEWLYYADRRGMMLAHHLADPEIVDLMRERGYSVFGFGEPIANPVHLARAWSWITPIGDHLYRVGDDAGILGPAPIVATDDIPALEAAVAVGDQIVAGPMSITCGQPHPLPAGREATWMRFSNVSDAARVSVLGVSAILPQAEGLVVLDGDDDGDGIIELECNGVEQVEIAWAVDAPRPDP